MTPRRAHPGLTLVELMVVMLLVALAAGAVAIRLHGPLRSAGFDDALDRIARHDATARRAALGTAEPVTILLSPDGTLQQVRASGTVQRLELPRGVRVARMLVVGQAAHWRDGSVPVGPHGLSPDYALAIEDDAGQTAWLLCAGLSGQWTRWQDEPAVRRLMQLARQEQRP